MFLILGYEAIAFSVVITVFLSLPILVEVVIIKYLRIHIIWHSFSSFLTIRHSSQFEEKFEEIEAPSDFLPSSGLNENPSMAVVTEESRGKEIEMQGQDAERQCSDLNASQDFVSGIMKIVPSDVDVSLVLDFYGYNSFLEDTICYKHLLLVLWTSKKWLSRSNKFWFLKYLFRIRWH